MHPPRGAQVGDAELGGNAPPAQARSRAPRLRGGSRDRRRQSAYNLRFLYSFGALTLDEDGEMIRTNGIVHTIKDGIVIENARLMEEVARMVARSKEGIPPNVAEEPFVIPRRPIGGGRGPSPGATLSPLPDAPPEAPRRRRIAPWARTPR